MEASGKDDLYDKYLGGERLFISLVLVYPANILFTMTVAPTTGI
jgi:hypothetical protein